MNQTSPYCPTGRTQAVRVACATIAIIFFAFGCYELFYSRTGSSSVFTLPVSFTFAMEAYVYTGSSKDTSRRQNGRFNLASLAMFLLGLVWILASDDAHWNQSTKLGILACFRSAHIVLFLTNFRQPYQQAETTRG